MPPAEFLRCSKGVSRPFQELREAQEGPGALFRGPLMGLIWPFKDPLMGITRPFQGPYKALSKAL